jgi:hypothetical protein
MAKPAQHHRVRSPMSEDQRKKLSEAQKRYVSSDPRWADHRRKLAEAQQRPEQKAILSAAQLAYMANDPRWPAHRVRMMQAAIETTRITLLPEEIETINDLRRKGRNFEYVSEELCVSEAVIRRELRARDIPTGRIKPRPKAERGKGFWRSFDIP